MDSNGEVVRYQGDPANNGPDAVYEVADVEGVRKLPGGKGFGVKTVWKECGTKSVLPLENTLCTDLIVNRMWEGGYKKVNFQQIVFSKNLNL